VGNVLLVLLEGEGIASVVLQREIGTNAVCEQVEQVDGGWS
jgi:hypothetical protein